MGLIRQKTATDIAFAYRDIEAGEKLLKKIREDKKWDKEVDLRDAFGRRRGLQLGIPSGENAHRLYDLSWDLAEPVIEAHIAKVRSRLQELCATARMELDGLRPDEYAEAAE